MKAKTPIERQEQALHALNCAIACLVAWPSSSDKLGGAVYFTALALHRLAQADTNGEAASAAESYLSAACETNSGVVAVGSQERP